MSNAIITQQDASYTEEQRKLITDVLCKDATPQEIEFFMTVSKRCNLDPFRRQIHAVKRWDSNLKRLAMTFQVAIDGLRAIASRTGSYAGSDDPIFEESADGSYPIKATCTVYRFVQGHKVAFTASVRWSEYVQTTKDGAVNSMWRQRPFGQLGKCAEAAALRKAFPEDTSGLYTEEETSAMPLSEVKVERTPIVQQPITQHIEAEVDVIGNAPPEHWSELLPTRWRTTMVKGVSCASLSDKDAGILFDTMPRDDSVQRMAIDARRYHTIESLIASRESDLATVETKLQDDGVLADGENITSVDSERLAEVSLAVRAMFSRKK